MKRLLSALMLLSCWLVVGEVKAQACVEQGGVALGCVVPERIVYGSTNAGWFDDEIVAQKAVASQYLTSHPSSCQDCYGMGVKYEDFFFTHNPSCSAGGPSSGTNTVKTKVGLPGSYIGGGDRGILYGNWVYIHGYKDRVCSNGAAYPRTYSVLLTDVAYARIVCPANYSPSWGGSPAYYMCKPAVEMSVSSPDSKYPNQDCADANTSFTHTTPNPIAIRNRCRNEQVEDLRVEAPYPLSWIRFASQNDNNSNWSMEGFRAISVPVLRTTAPYSGKILVTVRRRNGSALLYQATDIPSGPRAWSVVNQNIDSKLEEIRTGSVTDGWVLHQRSGEQEVFDNQGILQRKISPQGHNHHYQYGWTASKRLTKIRDDFGNALSLDYNLSLDSSVTIPSHGPVDYSTDLGRLVASSLPKNVSDGDRIVSYDWFHAWSPTSQSSVALLMGVEYPDGGIREYAYGETVEGNNAHQNSMTGIVDEEGARERTYKSLGSSNPQYGAEWMGAGPSGVGGLRRVDISTVSVVDQDGNTFSYSDTSSQRSFNKPCPDCIGTEGKYLRKDAQGYLTQIEDWVGNKTNFTYDSERRITQIVKAFGTPLAQTTTMTYDPHPKNRDPLTVTETVKNAAGATQLRTTTYTYSDLSASYPSSSPCSGAHGGVTVPCASTRRLLTQITIAIDDGSPARTWNFTYNNYGLRETMTDPTGQITKWTWTAKGQVETVTNAFGSSLAATTTFGGHTNKGPSWRIDPHGLVTRWHRDINGRITQEDVGTPASPSSIGSISGDMFVPASGGTWRTTTLNWRINNLLASTVLPSGQSMHFTYDGARRLTKVETKNPSNQLLWSKEYELSGAGSLLSETVKNGAGVVEYKNTMTYDGSRSVSSITDGELATTNLGYNLNAENTSSTTPLGHTSSRALDQLGRPKTFTDALGKLGQLTYGPQDEVLTAIDQRNVTTTYTYNGFGDVVSINSPDRGQWSFAYNAGGQNTTITDPRGVVQTNTYDDFGRVTARVFDDTSAAGAGRVAGVQTQSFTYDVCDASITTACTITDTSGQTTYTYNDFGQVLQQSWTAGSATSANGAVLTTQYSYTSDGRLSSITYPSGKVMDIGFGSDQRPETISYGGQPLMGDIEWNALSQVASWGWAQSPGWSGTHSTVTYTYDKTGRVSAINDMDERSLVWDNDRRLVGVNDASNLDAVQAYDYDALNRITEADIGSWPSSKTYGYDFASNRTSHSDTATSDGFQFVYEPNSNRLSSITPVVGGTPSTAQHQTYDAAGNLIDDGLGMDLAYNSEGRLANAQSGPHDVDMVYNAMGQRMIKHAAGNNPILYAYDQWRRPVGAYVFNATTSTWDVLEEYLHLDGWRVVGVARPNATSGMTTPDMFPVLSDHLGTPRKILNGATGQAVWAWDAKEPFGHELPNENPSALGSFTFNLRFPGQVFDVETGLFHNGYRDYHAKLGRYVQSDPLGLEAGWNTYGYVGGNSLGAIDPLGLDFAQNINNKIKVFIRQGVERAYETYNNLHMNGLGDTIIATNNALIATQKQNELVRQGKLFNNLNGSSDAFRHCLLSCLSGLMMGNAASLKMLNNHEAINALNGSDKKSTEMDLFNNAVGLQCSDDIKNGVGTGNCEMRCMSLIQKRGLMYE